MNPQEIKTAVEEIAAQFGRDAYVNIQIKNGAGWSGPGIVSATCYPHGVTRDQHAIHVAGDTFEGTLTSLLEKIAEESLKINAAVIRKLALKVIELTMDLGECSHAALRGAGFVQSEIDRFGALACEQAGQMAAGAPFVIVAANTNNPPAIATAAE